jgi:hypothetical protein
MTTTRVTTFNHSESQGYDNVQPHRVNMLSRRSQTSLSTGSNAVSMALSMRRARSQGHIKRHNHSLRETAYGRTGITRQGQCLRQSQW